MKILERYFEALRAHDWDDLADCLAEDVRRTGPFLDVVEGRSAYVKFLAGVIPALAGWSLAVSRIHSLEDGSALALLRETVEMDGVASEFPEALLFDFDADGRIVRVDVYMQRPA